MQPNRICLTYACHVLVPRPKADVCWSILSNMHLDWHAAEPHCVVKVRLLVYARWVSQQPAVHLIMTSYTTPDGQNATNHLPFAYDYNMSIHSDCDSAHVANGKELIKLHDCCSVRCIALWENAGPCQMISNHWCNLHVKTLARSHRGGGCPDYVQYGCQTKDALHKYELILRAGKLPNYPNGIHHV